MKYILFQRSFYLSNSGLLLFQQETCNCNLLFQKQIQLMHPKRFRERIEKADRFLQTRNQINRQTAIQFASNTPRPASVSQLQNAVIQITTKLLGLTKNSEALGNYTSQMEARDHVVIVQPPKLAFDQSERQKQIKLWVAQICHHVFSVSFNYFSNKIFDMQTTKAFSSESFIFNIIGLSKTNKLSKEDFQLINNHLKRQLLPYYLLRYPQSNNMEINQKLNKSVSTTDYLDTNQNNLFLKSKIVFQYHENGIYFDSIMKFINYIQQIPDKQLPKLNGLTLFQQFNQKMERIFTSVYNRKWTQSNLYDIFLEQQQSVETLRQNVQNLQNQLQQSIIKQVVKFEHNKQLNISESYQKGYEEAVKQYTKFAINRKVSQNVRLYSSEQIFHGNIKINSPAILRIIVKWCQQLEEKFQPGYYQERNQPFAMINGDEVQMIDDLRQKLNQYMIQEWAEIQKFLSDITNNIYQKQAELSFYNLMYYSSNKLSQKQESLIKFANRNTQDVHHYAVSYLNRLIHGLLKISKKIYDEHLQGWAEWPYRPNLISFTVSDLMRCKCSSKQKQILRIYKELELQSLINPDVFKIVKVKNRLSKGTKDILLNVLFHQQALCEIQLSIKTEKSQFTLWSDQFNHYIYQLQRSSYGPITQMCSIWCTLDSRSSLLKNELIRVTEIPHNCKNAQKVPEIFPFTCSLCYRHYSQSRFIYDHHKCTCKNFWVCALCRLRTLSQEELVKALNKKKKNNNIGERVIEEDFFPQYFLGFKLQSIKAVSQSFRKITVGKDVMIVSIQNGKLKVIIIKNNDKYSQLKKKLFQDFIFFAQKQPDPKLIEIQIQQVLDQTVIEQIAQCYKKKSQSLRITRKNITTSLLTKIKNPRSQQKIESIIFPQNLINSVKQIGQAFPNVKMLNLNKNKIGSLQGLSKMKKLTDLYLGQNLFKEIVELDNLTELKYVQLGDNINQPQFRCDLSKLVKLESLTLVRSNLSKFPEELCKVRNLKLLWLFQNRISQIPTSIKNLQQLQYLHLEMNELTELPKQLYYLKKLKKLMLSFNKINHLSHDIINLGLLQILSLQDNPLQNIPFEAISKFAFLQMIILNKSYQAEFMANKITAAIFK